MPREGLPLMAAKRGLLYFRDQRARKSTYTEASPGLQDRSDSARTLSGSFSVSRFIGWLY